MVDSKQRNLTRCNGQVSKGVVDLPLEIISDILSRLPIESIMTCRVVCKSWYSLTQDPDFINLQLSRSNYQPTRIILQPLSDRDTNYTVNHLLLLDTEEHKSKRIPIQRMLLKDRRVMCSCNGLLCIASNNKLDPVFICNPITRNHMKLPSSNSKLDSPSHQVGLGLDPSTGKYKVVRLYKDKSKASRFEILSLGESSWRELSVPHIIPGCHALGSVFWNGTLCWTMIKRVSLDSYNISILAFDLTEEKFQIISLPTEFSPQPYFDLLDLDGYLTLVEHDSDLMKVWRLTGEKVGDFSLCLEQTYETHVSWNDSLTYAVFGRLNHNDYLLHVGFWKDQHLKTHITQFFPQKVQYVHVDIPDISDNFKVFCFKPSLVSPVAASCLS
uniref:F-box domain-containing protein n=1 Tax=Davidia involucrata TaxID=16924 RepID=A0A5B7B982_DAVIN